MGWQEIRLVAKLLRNVASDRFHYIGEQDRPFSARNIKTEMRQLKKCRILDHKEEQNEQTHNSYY